jgi:hypothetical protein
VFAFFSILSLWVLQSDGSKEKDRLIIVVGLIIFTALSLAMVISILRGWTEDEESKIVQRTLKWIIIGPIVAIASILVIGGFLVTTPDWAALITVLLVLILLPDLKRIIFKSPNASQQTPAQGEKQERGHKDHS